MKALSIRNPWAAAILSGAKDVENRTWRPTLPVPFTIAVHAGKAFDRSTIPFLPIPSEADCADLAGTICGLVDVVSVHRYGSCYGTCSLWGVVQPWHWMLANPRRIEPVPWRGQLGIFTVPDDVVLVGA